MAAQRAGRVPECAVASARRARRARLDRLGRADEHDRLPPVARADGQHRQPRSAAHRPRPAARHGVRRRRARRVRDAGGAARRRPRGMDQDLGQPRHPPLRPDRAGVGVPRGAACRHRGGARARTPDAGSRDDVVVEGGARQTRVRRLQPGEPRPHDRRGVQSSCSPARARLDPARVGRAGVGRSARVHGAHGARATAHRRRPVGGVRREARAHRHAARVVGARRGGGTRRDAVPARLPEDAGRAAARAAEQEERRQLGCRRQPRRITAARRRGRRRSAPRAGRRCTTPARGRDASGRTARCAGSGPPPSGRSAPR